MFSGRNGRRDTRFCSVAVNGLIEIAKKKRKMRYQNGHKCKTLEKQVAGRWLGSISPEHILTWFSSHIRKVRLFSSYCSAKEKLAQPMLAEALRFIMFFKWMGASGSCFLWVSVRWDFRVALQYLVHDRQSYRDTCCYCNVTLPRNSIWTALTMQCI